MPLQEADVVVRSPQEFPIVGIGASAGGLEALERFFKATPPDTGLAFVVVQHLSPDHPSLMAELLAKHTTMPVMQAQNGIDIQANAVYLIPPGRNLSVQHRKLLLAEPEKARGQNFPINIFFDSLAEDVGDRAVAIVLSGTGSDGTLGIRSIKAMGGLALAQDEASARFDGMPENAIATGMVDFVCKPEEMPPLLLRLLFGRKHKVDDPPGTEALGDQSSFLKIFMLLRARKGLDFSGYKLATILRRVRRRMEVNMLDSSEKYATFLQGSPQEVDKLFHELLIGVTSFYRDEAVWDLVAERVVPQLFAGKPPGAQIRVWVPGCSTGEEAYTLAMIFSEVLGSSLKDYDIKIFATDVDKKSLEFAGVGRYPDGIETQITPDRLSRFFVKKNNSYKVSDAIRKLVIFAAQNITADPPFSRIDLITCRNLLIYLHPSAQRRVLSTFHFALNPNGFLVLGSSESLGEAGNLFNIVDSKNKVFQALGKKKGLRLSSLAAQSAQTLPSGPRSRTGPGSLMTLPAREDVLRPMSDALLAVCLPPTVVVNANGEIVHVHGDVSPFVRHSPGRASLNILKGTHKDLSVTIGMALSRVQLESTRISYREVVVHLGDSRLLVDVTVVPFPPERQHVGFCSITFETRGEEARSIAVPTDTAGTAESRQRIADLEWELQNSRENLHAVIEELETSNEELQSTNEELLAANEELQSTNEELQSLNEELHTVNAEYQLRIEELTEAKNDIDNLLKSSDIGVILLDRQLRIRKFNPAVTKEFHLIEADLGRPITHVSNRFQTGELPGLAEEVLRGGSARTFEATSDTGAQYSVQLAPYHEQTGTVAGVVVNLVDVTTFKDALTSVKQFSSAIAQGPTQVMFFDTRGRVTFVNQAFERETGYVAPQAIGRDFRFLLGASSSNDEEKDHEQTLWEELRSNGMWRGELTVRRRNGTVYTEMASISTVKNDAGTPVCYVKVSEDISERKDQEVDLQRAKTLLQKIIDGLPQTLAILDEEGRIVAVNERWRAFAEKNEFVGSDFGIGMNYIRMCEYARGQSSDGAQEVAKGLRALAEGQQQSFDFEYPCHSATERKWYAMHARRVQAEDQARIIVNHEDISRVKALEASTSLFQNALNEVFALEQKLSGSDPRNAPTATENSRYVFVFDSSGMPQWMSPNASTLLPDRGAFLTSDWWPGRGTEAPKSEFGQLLKRSLRTGIGVSAENLRLPGPQENHEPCPEIRVTPFFTPTQDFLGIAVELIGYA